MFLVAALQRALPPLGARFVGPTLLPGTPTRCPFPAVEALDPQKRCDLRNEPSPKGRRSFRPWQDGILPEELLDHSLGGALGPRDERVLGPAALALWRYLVQERGYLATWRRVSLKLAAETLAMGERRVDRAMARLKEAGLLRTRLVRRELPDPTGSGRPTRYIMALSVLVFGGVDEVAGQELIVAPTATLAWCDRAPGRGGRRSKVSPTPLPEPETVPRGTTGYGTKVSPSYISNNTIYINRVAANAAPSPARPGSRGQSMKQISQPSTTGMLPALVKPDDLPAKKIRMMVDAYQRGVREVFEERAYVHLPEDPTMSRLASRLVDAAEVMAEFDIPPAAWAVWALRLAREGCARQGKPLKAPHILAIMSPTYIKKRRGWFRKTSAHTYGQKVNVEPYHLEQLYRRKEATRRNLGRGDASLWGLPEKYVAKRMNEIAQGDIDPMVRFPKGRS